MALRKKPKERLPVRLDPGDTEPEPCSPGSIEQELDMCEKGSLRGDDILHSHGTEPRDTTGDPLELGEVIDKTWEMDELKTEDKEEEFELEGEHLSEEELLHPEEREIPRKQKG